VLQRGIIGRYLERAKELRSIADQIKDADARSTLIRAAETYERLADWIQPDPHLSLG